MNFEWIDYYTEFATKLLTFKDNREELIHKIYSIYDNIGISVPKLEKDDEITDIDPFTVFGLFNKVYGIKENPKFCYVHKQFSQPQYTYSMQAVELIVEEIKKDPTNIVENLKKSIKKH